MAVKDIDAKTLAYIKKKILEIIDIDEIVQKAAEAAVEAVEGIVEEAVEEEVEDKGILFLDDEGQIIGNTGPINIKPTLEHSNIRPIQIGPSGIIIGYDGNPIKKDNISGLVTELDGKVGASGFLDNSGKVKFEKVADLGNFAKKDTLIFTDVTSAIGSTGASAFRTSIGAKDIEWTPSQQDLINKGAFIGDVSTNSDGEVVVQRGTTGFSFAKPSIKDGKLIIGASAVQPSEVGAKEKDWLPSFKNLTDVIGATSAGASAFRTAIGAGTSDITQNDVDTRVENKVPAWARESSKPTYNASEVGVPEWAQSASKPTYTADEVGVKIESGKLKIGTTGVTAGNVGAKESTYAPSYSEITNAIGSTGASAFRSSIGLGSLATKSSVNYTTDISNRPTIPSKVSELTNDSKFAKVNSSVIGSTGATGAITSVSYEWNNDSKVLSIILNNNE